MPSFRVKAHYASVKDNFGEYFGSYPRLPFGPQAKALTRSRLPLSDEGLPHEAGDDRHGVLGETEVEVLPAAEAYETPGGAVTAERPFGPRKVQIHNALRPLVELGAFFCQAIEDSTRSRLILGCSATLPAAADHRNH